MVDATTATIPPPSPGQAYTTSEMRYTYSFNPHVPTRETGEHPLTAQNTRTKFSRMRLLGVPRRYDYATEIYTKECREAEKERRQGTETIERFLTIGSGGLEGAAAGRRWPVFNGAGAIDSRLRHPERSQQWPACVTAGGRGLGIRGGRRASSGGRAGGRERRSDEARERRSDEAPAIALHAHGPLPGSPSAGQRVGAAALGPDRVPREGGSRSLKSFPFRIHVWRIPEPHDTEAIYHQTHRWRPYDNATSFEFSDRSEYIMSSARIQSSAKRIQKELAEISLDPPENCSAGPKGAVVQFVLLGSSRISALTCPPNRDDDDDDAGDNIYEWVSTLIGPSGSPYSGGTRRVTRRTTAREVARNEDSLVARWSIPRFARRFLPRHYLSARLPVQTAQGHVQDEDLSLQYQLAGEHLP